MVEKFERNAYIRLKAFPKYWGPKPAFETVVFKLVPDATSRAAEVESGASDLTLELPFEEFDRLTKKPTLTGVAYPVSDIGMIFITNRDVMLDKNVRLAMIQSVDKKAIVDKLLRGHAVVIDTLEAPQYAAFDPSIKVALRSGSRQAVAGRSPGFGPDKPVKLHHPDHAAASSPRTTR